MIVELREYSQAARVAALTGGTRLPGKTTRPDGAKSQSLLVDFGPDFEHHRAAVESMSVLFRLFDGDTASYARTGGPGTEAPSGWTVSGARFEVEWPSDPRRQAVIRSHFGARRKVFNWTLADRLARFGTGLIEHLLSGFGVTATYIGQPNEETAAEAELVRDMIAIVTSLAGSMYGQWSTRTRRLRAAVTAGTRAGAAA